MKENKAIATFTYDYNDTYRIDIVVDSDSYDAYLYNIKYGVKSLMFGGLKSQNTYDSFLALVESNVEEYIEYYKEDYEDDED